MVGGGEWLWPLHLNEWPVTTGPIRKVSRLSGQLVRARCGGGRVVEEEETRDKIGSGTRIWSPVPGVGGLVTVAAAAAVMMAYILKCLVFQNSSDFLFCFFLFIIILRIPP